MVRSKPLYLIAVLVAFVTLAVGAVLTVRYYRTWRSYRLLTEMRRGAGLPDTPTQTNGSRQNQRVGFLQLLRNSFAFQARPRGLRLTAPRVRRGHNDDDLEVHLLNDSDDAREMQPDDELVQDLQAEEGTLVQIASPSSETAQDDANADDQMIALV